MACGKGVTKGQPEDDARKSRPSAYFVDGDSRVSGHIVRRVL